MVAEALAHGLPVLTTTGAPWEILLKERCGWWVAPTVVDIREGLRAALSASDNERRAMGHRGRLVVQARFAWEHVAAAVHEQIYAPLLTTQTT